MGSSEDERVLDEEEEKRSDVEKEGQVTRSRADGQATIR